MVGECLPACTCPVAGVCYCRQRNAIYELFARLNEKDIPVWQGFSLTIKSRNFVRTNLGCGTETPSVCTKIASTLRSQPTDLTV